MKRKPYPITQITGGLDVSKDPIYLADAASPSMSCVRYHKGLIKKDFAFSSLANLTSERVMHFHMYRKYDGTYYTICCGVDHAYKYDAGVWTKISSTGPVFTGGEDNTFFSATFNNLFIVTNGKDAIQKWNGTTWANLGGATIPSAARFLIPFYSRLVLFYTQESSVWYPMRVRWSIVGNPEDWAATGSGAIDIIDTQDAITGVARLGDRVFIFKETSVWELYYVGGTDYFKVRQISDAVGCQACKTIVTFGSYLLFVGTDNIYKFDGATFSTIGDPIHSMVYQKTDRLVNLMRINRSFAISDFEAKQYVVVMPTNDNQTPNLALKYDTQKGVWTKRTKECTALGYFYRGSGAAVAWSGATDQWEDAVWDIPWIADLIGNPEILYGQATGVVQTDDKSTVTTESLVFDTKDFLFGHSTRWVEVRCLCKGGAFTLQYSYDQGVTWTDPTTVTPASSTVFGEVINQINNTAMSIRIRVTAANDIELKWIEPWYIPRTRAEGPSV